MASAVEVTGLEKHYGDVRAVDGISFSVGEGEVFGLLGHNGAGKTTTIRMLTGRARPTRGTATVAGYDIVNQRESIEPLINAVFEDQNLYERSSGRENLRLFAELYGVPASRADELLELVGLTAAAKRKVKAYSSGMKQRLLVARALVNTPRVLFMDEPTRGLDPTSARELRPLIARLADQGTTVFLTTHYRADARAHALETRGHSHVRRGNRAPRSRAHRHRPADRRALPQRATGVFVVEPDAAAGHRAGLSRSVCRCLTPSTWCSRHCRRARACGS